MGGLCSRSANVDNAPGGSFPVVNGHVAPMVYQTRELKTNVHSAPPPVGVNVEDKQLHDPISVPGLNTMPYPSNEDDVMNDGIPRLARVLSQKSRSTKSKPAAVVKVH